MQGVKLDGGFVIKNHVLTFEVEGLRRDASLLFEDFCRLKLDAQTGGKKVRTALKASELVLQSLAPAAIISRYPPDCLSGDMLTLDGACFKCAAFIPLDGYVDSVFAYLLTVGELPKGGDMLEDFFLYTWGTCYLYAAKLVMERFIASNTGAGRFVSPSYGPGYYGMDPRHMDDIAAVLDSEKIGITLSAAHQIIPEKSAGGAYFALTQGDKVDLNWCRYCNKGPGCNFCNMRTPAV